MTTRVGGVRFLGAGTGFRLRELTSAFLSSDDFVRANSPVVGGGWVETLETVEILSNRLRMSGGGGGQCRVDRPASEATAANWWVQSISRWNTDTVSTIPLIGSTSTADSYFVLQDDFGALLSLRRGPGSILLDSVGVAMDINVFYVTQLATRHAAGPVGEQTADWFRQSSPAAIRTLSAADTAFTGNRRPALLRGSGTVQTADYDTYLACRGAVFPNQIRCTGMRVGVGDRIQVRNAADAVVVQAIEGAVTPGEAHIILSGLASGVEWPLAGFPSITLSNNADTLVLARLSGSQLLDAGVYPGGTFSAS